MSLPTHHPGDALLMDYASGSLGEGPALVVASHAALCPGCRCAVAEMEAVGGALLESIEPDPLSPGCLDRLLARLDEDGPEPPPPVRRPPAPQRRAAADGPLLPEPLRSYIGGCPDALRWRPMLPGIRVAEIPLTVGSARLIRIAGGTGVPQHSHDGVELAMVLQGGFSDAFGHYLRGDVAVGDDTIDHRPLADPEGCLCLSVTMGTLRLTGPVGRFLNPFLRL
ncbi:ChrR family anti-sigma-E factor [Azospirillum halopraeferens]|uniref:ChrR family anti-sigma-E factor n=1 Tax=Azospirillum halopraeferens TaxID=34010 RepID=UPI0004207BF4|nr:ChrR family anti-sigma-E factor [Azospirillum halopraeferens]